MHLPPISNLCVLTIESDPGTLQPELQFQVSDIEVHFCEVLSVIGVSGSVGSIDASVKSSG